MTFVVPLFLASFSHIDWLILIAYFALMGLVGVLAARRKHHADAVGYFLAERSMPVSSAVIVMVTPGSTAPDESDTVPSMAPLAAVDCAVRSVFDGLFVVAVIDVAFTVWVCVGVSAIETVCACSPPLSPSVKPLPT